MLAQHLVRRALSRTLALSPVALSGVMGPPPRNDRGVLLDAQVFTLLRLAERAGRPTMDELGPERARKEMTEQAWLFSGAAVPLHRVEDQRIETPAASIPIRIYTPDATSTSMPALVFYHGGGFVVGDLESHDRVCRRLARTAGAIVVAVDYRLAPENPFPAGAEDAEAAFRWVHKNASALGIDPARIAVGGDSAGGNLSAVTCQQLRDAGGPMPAFQLLIYPSVDMTRSHESHRTFAHGFFLTTPLIDWFLANYLSDPPNQERDPRASPLATADLSRLPPAHVVVAGFDPLRDEGEAYAKGLMAAGVPVTLRSYSSLIHGFVNLGGVIEAAAHAVDDLAEQLRLSLWEA